MADSDGLEHAPDAVAQMHADKDHCNNVGDRGRNHFKPGDEVVIGIKLGEIRMKRAGGQVQQMKDDEGRDDRTAPHHRSRCEAGLHVRPFDIRDRPCLLLQQGKRDRSPDVQHDRNDSA